MRAGLVHLVPKVDAVPQPLVRNLAHSSHVQLSDQPDADLGAEPQEVLTPAWHAWMFANHEPDKRTLRLGVHTHSVAAIAATTPVCVLQHRGLESNVGVI